MGRVVASRLYSLFDLQPEQGMTAEVAVMNRSAMALAADSLVTVQGRGQTPEKTYEANKLFTLSKHHPVGVMVYGNVHFMEVPWETAVKVYRRQLGRRSFDTVQQYAEDFLSWVSSSDLLSPDERQRRWFAGILNSYLEFLDEEIDRAAKAEIDEAAHISHERIVAIVGATIRRHRDELTQNPPRADLPTDFAETLQSTHCNEIDEAISSRIGRKPLSDVDMRHLREIAASIFCREVDIPFASGVVVAGFGDREEFPVVRAFSVYGAVNGKLISRLNTQDSVDRGTVAVIPFAQRDVADTFLRGMDGEALDTIVHYQEMLFYRLPSIIADNIDCDEDAKSTLESRLQAATSIAMESFRERLLAWLRKRHIDPLLEVLSVVPKEELADLAESLVSLTSVKRKMSMGLETVGGPIDVAIISKGDGFVWIRRKHYFDPKLNAAFLASYLER